MSDIFATDEIFRRTHELKKLHCFHPGYAAECFCGYGTGYRRLALSAVLAHGRHKNKALKS